MCWLDEVVYVSYWEREYQLFPLKWLAGYPVKDPALFRFLSSTQSVPVHHLGSDEGMELTDQCLRVLLASLTGMMLISQTMSYLIYCCDCLDQL